MLGGEIMFGIPGMDLGRIILYVVIGIIYVYKFVKHKKLANLIMVFVCIYGLTSASFILKPYRDLLINNNLYIVVNVIMLLLIGLLIAYSILSKYIKKINRNWILNKKQVRYVSSLFICAIKCIKNGKLVIHMLLTKITF